MTTCNIFQRDTVQMVFSCGTTIVCLLMGEILFVRLYANGVFPEGVRTIAFIIAAIALVVAFSFWVMRQTLKLNLISKVSMPKIVEFSYAMQQLNVSKFDKQIDLLAEKKMPIFISDETLPPSYKESISVKRYLFLNNKEKLKSYNGDRRLCLNACDFESLLKEHKQISAYIESEKVEKLQKTVMSLEADKSQLYNENIGLQEQNTTLLAIIEKLENTLQTAPGREIVLDNRERNKIPLRRVAWPTINTLIATATLNTEYTRPQIQEAFLQELEKFPQLKPEIRNVLRTPDKERYNTPYSLKGWAMEEIRFMLGDLVQKEGKAPKKSTR